MSRTRTPIAGLASILLLAGCSSKESGPAATSGSPGPVDPAAPLPSSLPAVAAKVDGTDVPSLTVAVYARLLIARAKFTKDQKPQAMRSALDHLVERELLLQEALRRGIVADESALNIAYDTARARYKTDADWAAFLAEQGTDPTAYRQELRVQKTIEVLLRQVPDVAALTRDLKGRARIERFF